MQQLRLLEHAGGRSNPPLSRGQHRYEPDFRVLGIKHLSFQLTFKILENSGHASAQIDEVVMRPDIHYHRVSLGRALQHSNG